MATPVLNSIAAWESAGLLLLLGAAVALDLKHRIIPNWLTVAGALCGSIFQVLRQGLLPGLIFSLWGLLLGMALLMLPFMLEKSGGGDVKLLGAMGAWLGPQAVLISFLYGALAGGVMALFYRRYGRRAEQAAVQLGSPNAAAAVERAGRLPYSLPLAAGYLVYLFKGAPL